MFDFRKNISAEATQGADKLNYSKYYEHDGALRAYANRAMVLAGSMTLLAFLSLGFAVYVRIWSASTPKSRSTARKKQRFWPQTSRATKPFSSSSRDHNRPVSR